MRKFFINSLILFLLSLCLVSCNNGSSNPPYLTFVVNAGNTQANESSVVNSFYATFQYGGFLKDDFVTLPIEEWNLNPQIELYGNNQMDVDVNFNHYAEFSSLSFFNSSLYSANANIAIENPDKNQYTVKLYYNGSEYISNFNNIPYVYGINYSAENVLNCTKSNSNIVQTCIIATTKQQDLLKNVNVIYSYTRQQPGIDITTRPCIGNILSSTNNQDIVSFAACNISANSEYSIHLNMIYSQDLVVSTPGVNIKGVYNYSSTLRHESESSNSN
jgi:hypothetical protein